MFTFSITSILPITSCNYVDNSYQENVVVNKVIDGDTYLIGNSKIRLLGVDTPETNDKDNNFNPTEGKKFFYGFQAKKYVANLIENKKVNLLKIKKDKYDRDISKVTYSRNDLSSLLIKNGFAVVRYIDSNKKSPFYYSDQNYIENLWDLQNEARINKRGFWIENDYSLKQIFPNYKFN